MISFQNVPSCFFFFAYFVVISTCSYLQSFGFLIRLFKAIFILYWRAIRANTKSYPVSMNTYPIQLDRLLSKYKNMPLPTSKNSFFQNEAKCKTFLVKMGFICMRIKNHATLKASLWNRGSEQLVNGLLVWGFISNHFNSIYFDSRGFQIMFWKMILIYSYIVRLGFLSRPHISEYFRLDWRN